MLGKVEEREERRRKFRCFSVFSVFHNLIIKLSYCDYLIFGAGVDAREARRRTFPCLWRRAERIRRIRRIFPFSVFCADHPFLRVKPYKILQDFIRLQCHCRTLEPYASRTVAGLVNRARMPPCGTVAAGCTAASLLSVVSRPTSATGNTANR
jgi:hypothetical protein